MPVYLTDEITRFAVYRIVGSEREIVCEFPTQAEASAASHALRLEQKHSRCADPVTAEGSEHAR